MISLNIKLGGLQGLAAEANMVQGLSAAAANEVQIAMQERFSSLGGREFWGNVARATTVSQRGDGAVVSVNHPGVRLQWLGGTVLPGKKVSSKTGAPTKLLALPADKTIREAPNAYGDLFFVPIANKSNLKGLLVPGERKTVKRGKGKGEQRLAASRSATPKFYLVSRTDHVPHPDVLPSADEFKKGALNGCKSYLRAMKIQARGK